MRPAPAAHAMPCRSALLPLLLLAAGAAFCRAAPPPTDADVRYGPHARQVLDFWRADSSRPTPLVFFIHGGGWIFGDKDLVTGVERYLAAGISVVSINYRYTWQAASEGIAPPVKAPLDDAARAQQFVRSRASAWNLDRTLVAAAGRSAGACAALWLAFRNDLADPRSADPVARESTRVACVAVVRAQTTLDPQQMVAWTPNSNYGGHAFGFIADPADRASLPSQFGEFLAARDRVRPWIEAYSPYAHVTPDDPPVYLIYDSAPALGRDAEDPIHTANFGVQLREKLRAVHVPCELVYPGATDIRHADEQDFIIATLAMPKR